MFFKPHRSSVRSFCRSSRSSRWFRVVPFLGIALVVGPGVARPVHAQSVLNGSFETNSSPNTQANMTNLDLSATVASVTAFGDADEIDLVNGGDIGPATPFGAWKLRLHTQTLSVVDAFTIALSGPLVPGQSYTLSFWAATERDNVGAVEVGISERSNTFGDLVFSGQPNPDGNWTNLGTTFVAPSAGGFLTVRSGAPEGTITNVDNFSLSLASSAPEPGALALLALGAIGLPATRRKR